ncbi:MAG: polymer-forming cytoskeletal protein [Oscillospiraceae bacterium]|nr:polymer-forming cytoskeletal protein [Oscillospiraceae bacterium]
MGRIRKSPLPPSKPESFTSIPLSHGSAAPTQNFPATVISQDAEITGDIKAKGDVEIVGSVQGNIETSGNVIIKGTVTGNIKGDEVSVMSAHIKGNVESESVVTVERDSVIIGDINSKNISLDGKIKGNLAIANTALFKENAAILGNVTVGKLSMSEGALFTGELKMNGSDALKSTFGE